VDGRNRAAGGNFSFRTATAYKRKKRGFPLRIIRREETRRAFASENLKSENPQRRGFSEDIFNSQHDDGRLNKWAASPSSLQKSADKKRPGTGMVTAKAHQGDLRIAGGTKEGAALSCRRPSRAFLAGRLWRIGG
jgi:hypothetical protein